MSMIKKILGLGFCFFSINTMASQNYSSLYEQLYGLTEQVYYNEYLFSVEQKTMIKELATQMETVLAQPKDTVCGNKSTVYQDAYKWSYSFDGLNYPSSKAEEFALSITNKFCPATYL